MASGGSPDPVGLDYIREIDDNLSIDGTSDDDTKGNISQLANDLTRVVIVGKTGSGKSSLGNRLHGDRPFVTKLCPKSVTNTTCVVLNNKEHLEIVDTPGFFNTNLKEKKVKDEIEKAIKMTKPAHLVFLYTIKIGRYSEEESKSINTFVDIFGDQVYRYTIVVFTAKDYLINENVEKYIEKLPENIEQFINKCSDRVISINNYKDDSKHFYDCPNDLKHDIARLIKEIHTLQQSNQSDCFQVKRPRAAMKTRLASASWRGINTI